MPRPNSRDPESDPRAFVAKFTERIAALFDTPERFAGLFSTAVIITPAKLRI
jgi:hypothetical protein